MQEIYQKIYHNVEADREQLLKINDAIYHHPELGNQEFFAAEQLTTALKEAGFSVEQPYRDLATGFRATFDTGKPGPTIAVMGEYDALPDIGHGCGHNMIGSIALGAARALAKEASSLRGRIVMLGTPAEETNGGKVVYAATEVFEDIDAAMIVHPGSKNALGSTSLAIDALEFVFHGRTCHASGNPEDGINALDGAILTFNNVNALRQHVTSDIRIHGVITEGGKAPNVTPDLAIARFYVRAKKREYLSQVVEKVKNCARGAAIATGCTLDISNFEFSNDNMKPNVQMTKTWEQHMRALGVTDFKPLDLQAAGGSTDCGNVSQKVPAIHPSISITEGKEVSGHSRDFASATITEAGHEALLLASKAVACTVADLLMKDELLTLVKEEFKNNQ